MAKKRKKVPRYLRTQLLEPGRVTAQCPTCGEQRDVAPILRIEATLARGGGWAVQAAQRQHLHWACQSCLDAGRALAGDPTRQVYCCDMPIFAYRDQRGHCVDCGAAFPFPASEQKFWYEQLQFVLASRPIRCPPCRRRVRATKRANTDLARALAELDPNNAEQLATISSLYLAMGLRVKAAEYLRRAKNKTWRKSRWDELVKALEEVEAKGPETVINLRIGGRTLRFRERP